MSTVKTIERTNFIGKIVYDETPESPRDWDNLGTMICFHGRYNLGDKHGYNKNDYSSWDELEKAILVENGRDAIILPVYMYDHSGVSLSTTPFSCRWDSGQVGFIVVDRDTVRKEYGVKRITAEKKALVEYYLKGEVETYSQYLNGDVYGYEVYSIDEDGNEEFEDSCYGYYGMEYVEKELAEHVSMRQEQYNIEYGVQEELELVA